MKIQGSSGSLLHLAHTTMRVDFECMTQTNRLQNTQRYCDFLSTSCEQMKQRPRGDASMPAATAGGLKFPVTEAIARKIKRWRPSWFRF